METIAEIRKLDAQKINARITELKKEYFENKQKLLKGEFKEVANFAKARKTIAKLNMVLAEQATANKETK